MIDRVARKRSAEALRHFLGGQITNEEFLRRYPNSKADPAIWALDDTVWCLYDDIITHKLSGKYAIPNELKKDAARWLMFLYSDKEYRWPKIGAPGFRHYPSWFCRTFNFARKRFDKFRVAGDYSVWPFLQREDFEDARQRPVLLSGNIQPHVGPERR